MAVSWPPELLVDTVPFGTRLLAVMALQGVVAVYIRSFAYHQRAGLPRVLASLPAIALLLAFPAFFSIRQEVLPRTSLLFMCSWLGSHKVLAMCLNRGPLATSLSLVQFFTLLYLPVFPQVKNRRGQDGPKGRLSDASGGPLQLALQAMVKIALLGFVVYLISAVQLTGIIKNLLYSFGLVGFLGLIMDGPASLATSLIGLRIIPTFDQPWLSASLADFWGRRWNITTSSVLRTLYYDPLVEGRLIKPLGGGGGPGEESESQVSTPVSTPRGGVKKKDGMPKTKSFTSRTLEALNTLQPGDPDADSNNTKSVSRSPKWRRLVGVFATFAASGLAHEYIINMVLAPNPDGSRPWLGKWTAYFTLQAPLLIAETQLRRLWRKAGLPQPNVWLARAITIPFLLMVADPLFFAPCERDSNLANLVVERVTENFMAVGKLFLLAGHTAGAGLMQQQGVDTKTFHAATASAEL